MILGKRDHLIGLDIGSATIKAAEILTTKKGLKLKSFGAVDIPVGTVAGGLVKDPEVVVKSIKELLRSSKIRGKNVALSVGGDSVVVKKINVRKMSEEELTTNIRFEAEQYIPFDIDDVNIDFQILGDSEQNSNRMSVLLVAVKKEIVEGYLDLMRIAGLNPCIIDVDAFAVQNIYEVCRNGQDSDQDYIALIDVGANKSSLNIVQGSTSHFLRDVNHGCNMINEMISEATGCSIEDSEDIKLMGGADRISGVELGKIITSAIIEWTTEISRALDFFYATYPGDKIKRAVISGGGGNIPGFRELMEQSISAEVEGLDPFSGLIIDEGRFDSKFLNQMAPRASTSLGLALRRVNDK